MSSKRAKQRRDLNSRIQRQSLYIFNLPSEQKKNDDLSSSRSSSDSENLNILHSESNSSESDNSSREDFILNSASVIPERKIYFEAFFTTIMSHIGLNLTAAEAVINLFNCVNQRFSGNPIILPSIRHYWDTQAKFNNVHTYILCEKGHSHGPFMGEPKLFDKFQCDEILQDPELKPGEFFLHIPLRRQLENILPTLSDSSWLQDSVNTDVSNSKLASRLKSVSTNSYCKKLTLTLHADEVASSKSSSEKIFPVFISINELIPSVRRKLFFLIALYVGKTKPQVECFFNPIIEELNQLSKTPVNFHGRNSRFLTKATFHVIALVADAPMRSYIRNTKQYNHFHGCDWCLIKASTFAGARSFPNKKRTEIRDLERKHQDFIDYKNLIESDDGGLIDVEISSNSRFKGINGISPLLALDDFDIVKSISVEPMHCISLGVFRNLLMKGMLTPGSASLFEKKVDHNFFRKEMSSRLVSISVPSEMTRIPRDLNQIKFWKSNEFDSFLAYFLYPTFKGLLKPAVANHLLCLVRLHYLSHVGPADTVHIEEILNLVEEFQHGCASLYGSSFLTYNLHILSHLADSLENLGPNSNISSYPLEDYMGRLKKKVHRFNNLGPSLVRFFMSDFKYSEFKTTIMSDWNLTQLEKKYFGLIEKEDRYSQLIEKANDDERNIKVTECLTRYMSGYPINPANIKYLKSIKYRGIRYSTNCYSISKKRDDSKIKTLDGKFSLISYIIDYESDIFLCCFEYSLKPVNVSFNGFNGFFSFPMENIHEIIRISDILKCYKLDSVESKVFIVRSSTFYFRYKADFIIEQFLRNK